MPVARVSSGIRKLILIVDLRRFVLGMLVGPMNPFVVRVHVGMEGKRIKTSDKISGLPNEISEIASTSKTDQCLPSLDTFRTFAARMSL